ncbi:hemin uptake protein HemP [Sphaerotilus sp.]|uniref:hemin uptake protein HemP n=1 Tax=Sphaerotilus sp. TaxID=2093942 RepID=UPI002ACE605D|nr:hemin uptake protein HemP [Sphaerotilus sp.]MDZ7856384.1 hemin uptake protein HemP [Sphaerotilus sp.]
MSSQGAEAVGTAPPAQRRISSRALMDGQREIEIEHDGALYRLRLTALGKLILTK